MEISRLKEAVEAYDNKALLLAGDKHIKVLVDIARSVLEVAGKLPEPFKYISTHTQPTCDCKYCAKVDGFNMCLDQCILAYVGKELSGGVS